MTQERIPIRLIKSSEIKQHFTMIEAIEAMEEAFKSLSSGESFVPQRYVTTFGDKPLNLLLKPVFVDSTKRASIKILTQKEIGAINHIPAIIGVVMLIDTLTGEILAIMDGEYLTSLRTGAASGLATKYFAREDATTLAIYGCRAQARTQLEAVNAVRNISEVWVFDKDPEKAISFVKEFENYSHIKIAKDLTVLKTCDIICTVTNSEQPLFQFKHLKKGVHINAIGSYKPNMQEIDPEILQKASIYVDQKEVCLLESGDFIKPIQKGLFNAEEIKGDIGTYALGKIKGRNKPDEITLFKSVGVAIQDFTVANKIYEKSIAKSFGQSISLFD